MQILLTAETGLCKVMTLCTVFLSWVILKYIFVDSAKLYLWKNTRNEPKLTHSISAQSSNLLNPPVSIYLLPGGAALFRTLSRALLERVNYVSLPSFSLAVQIIPLMSLIYLLKCLISQIICPFPKVIDILTDTGNVLFCLKVFC